MSADTTYRTPKLLERCEEYTIGIVCALPSEARAVRAAFDFTVTPRKRLNTLPGDKNTYSYGTMGEYHVVLAHMRGMGKSEAKGVAENMARSFVNIKLCLLVGICGIIPRISAGDAVLGDLVISTTVKQYDFGRQIPTGFKPKDTVEESLRKAPIELGNFMSYLKSADDELQAYTLEHLNRLELKVEQQKAEQDVGLAEYLYPPSVDRSIQDLLYKPDHFHQHARSQCTLCNDDKFCQGAMEADCSDLNCGTTELLPRRRLQMIQDILDDMPKFSTARQKKLNKLMPRIHLGGVASGDTVMKDGAMRDRIAAEHKVIAFEMEGAGVWDSLPTVIIKGACDYCDSHKNKKFQKYAALTAAACAKALLELVQMGISKNVEFESDSTSDLVQGLRTPHHGLPNNNNQTRNPHARGGTINNFSGGTFNGANMQVGNTHYIQGNAYFGRH